MYLCLRFFSDSLTHIDLVEPSPPILTSTSRLLKNSASSVLASFRPQRTPRVCLGRSLAGLRTAFLNSLRDRAHVALAVRTFDDVRADGKFIPQTAHVGGAW